MLRRQAALFFCLSFGCAIAAEESWRTYVNPRFGVAVDYPPIFAREDRSPDNSDGQTFRTQRGEAVLRVFGAYNVLYEKADRLMAAQKQSSVAYTYERAAKTWFVLSGTKNGQISYLRCNLEGRGSDVFGCVELEYPSTGATRWNDVVARVAGSLRFGSVRSLQVQAAPPEAGLTSLDGATVRIGVYVGAGTGPKDLHSNVLSGVAPHDFPNGSLFTTAGGLILMPVAISVEPAKIVVRYPNGARFGVARFNGYHFAFSGVPPITGVTLDGASTFKPRDVRFTSESIDVNVSGQAAAPGAQAILNIVQQPAVQTAPAGAGATVMAQDLPSSVREAIAESRRGCKTVATENGFLTRQDINGDDRPDFVLNYGAFICDGDPRAFCGSLGCRTQVFASLPDGGYAKVVDENVRKIDFREAQGRPAMVLGLAGDADSCRKSPGDLCEVVETWNGSSFVANGAPAPRSNAEPTPGSQDSIRKALAEVIAMYGKGQLGPFASDPVMRRHFTAQFISAWDRARASETLIIDADPFTGQGVSSINLQGVDIVAETPVSATVEMHLGGTNLDKDNTAFSGTQRIWMRREGQVWKIDDIADSPDGTWRRYIEKSLAK